MDDLVMRLRSLRRELELRFTGQFVENTLCTIDACAAALTAAQAREAADKARIAELEAELAEANVAERQLLPCDLGGDLNLDAHTAETIAAAIRNQNGTAHD